MKKNQVCGIIIHDAENINSGALPGRVSAFYVQITERRLNDLSLTSEEKIIIIDRIIEKLKSGETGDI